MKVIKKFFEDKGRVGISIICLLILIITMICAVTGDTLAATTICMQCNSNSSIIKEDTSTAADSQCPGGYHTIVESYCGYYTVTLNPNGGGVTSNTKTVKVGETYGSFPTAARTGYTFIGWFTSADGGRQIISTTKVETESNHTLYAHWSANEYRVTFDPNGGSVIPAFKSVEYKATYGSLPTPTKAGYTFTGWRDKNGNSITASSTVTEASDHTLYARWSASEYTVTLYSVGEKYKTFKVTYGETYSGLPTPPRTGYVFLGWYADNPEYTPEPSDSAKVEATDKVTITNDIYLYAWWEESDVTVTLDPNGGGVTSKTKYVNYGKTYGSFPTAVRTGYTFLGWYTAKTGGTKITASTTVTKTSDHTLYAHWEGLTIRVTLETDGGHVNYNGFDAKVEGTYSNLPPNPTKTGYTFTGWYDKYGNKITASSTVTETSDHTLYAHWNKESTDEKDDQNSSSSDNQSTTKITYYVKYNSNGGTGTMSNSTHIYNKSSNLKTNTFTKENCTFKGWNTKSDGSGTSYTDGQTISKLSSTNNATVNLYAQWQQDDETTEPEDKETITYYIEYNSNEGTGTMLNSTHIYGETSNLTKNTFTKENYIFKEWNTEKDGSGTSYEDGQQIKDLTSTNDEIIKLYAQWNYPESDDENNNSQDDKTDNESNDNNNDNNGLDSNNNTENNQDDDTITSSPQTGSIAFIIVSIVGFASLGYLIYRNRKNNDI